MTNKKILWLMVGIIMMISGSIAYGSPILTGYESGGVWYGSDTDGRQSMAVIETTSSGFDIILWNLATQTTHPNEVLAGIFFGTADGAAPIEATRVTGTPMSTDPSFVAIYGDNLSGEWGFLADIDGINGSFGEYGVSSTGFNPEFSAPNGWMGFGYDSLIDPSVAYGSPASPNGPSFGIMTGDPSLFRPSMDPFVLDFARISFSGSPDMIDEMYFLYGTDYDNVPEPATVLLLGSGLIGLGILRKRAKK